MNKPSYYFYLTEFWSETLPLCFYGLNINRKLTRHANLFINYANMQISLMV